MLVSFSMGGGTTPYTRQFWSEVPLPEGAGEGAVTLSAMVVGDEGRKVYVAGWEDHAFQASDYLLWCVETDGRSGWMRRYDHGPGIRHRARQVRAMGDGGVLLTGDTVTLRYDREGNLRWGVPYPGKELLMGEDGTIYVSGRMGWNSVTAALDPDGKVRWTNSLPRVADGDRAEGPRWSVWDTYTMMKDGDDLIQIIYQTMAYPTVSWSDGTRAWMGMRWMTSQGAQTRVQHLGSMHVSQARAPARSVMGRWMDQELVTGVEWDYEVSTFDLTRGLWHHWGLGSTNPVEILLPRQARLTPHSKVLSWETGGLGVVLGDPGQEQVYHIQTGLPLGISPTFGGQVFGSWTQWNRVVGLAKVAVSGTAESPQSDLEILEYGIGHQSVAAWRLEAPPAREWKPVVFGEDPEQPGRLLFLGQWIGLEGESRWMTGWYSMRSRLTVTGWSPFRITVSGPARSALVVEVSPDLLVWQEAGELELDGNGNGTWEAAQPMETGYWRMKQP